MNIKTGNRKLLAFLITLFIFTFVVIFAIVLIHPTNLDMSTFVFQLGTAYSIISGLFFGSNVLEHFSQKNNSQQ